MMNHQEQKSRHANDFFEILIQTIIDGLLRPFFETIFGWLFDLVGGLFSMLSS